MNSGSQVKSVSHRSGPQGATASMTAHPNRAPLPYRTHARRIVDPIRYDHRACEVHHGGGRSRAYVSAAVLTCPSFSRRLKTAGAVYAKFSDSYPQY